MSTSRFVMPLALLLLLPLTLLGQQLQVVEGDEWCENAWTGSQNSERFCEVREGILDAGDRDVRIDGRQNGGVKVYGWSRDEIHVRARVVGNGRSKSAAEDIAKAVRINTADARIYSEGPKTRSREWFSVSYEVLVPMQSDVQVKTKNGGIEIADVDGRVLFDALNGGVTLSGLAGDIEGQTTNGSLKVELTGDEWDGHGMKVRTTNGSVNLLVPEDYSAQLETGTVNGSIDIDFPVTVEGKIGRSISTELGAGGRTISARTTNGRVNIKRG